MRVVPSVVGLAVEVEPPAAVRPDRGGDAHGVRGLCQGPALLDVEFDERADAGEALGVGPDGLGVVSGALHRPGEGDPLGVPQRVGLLGRELPGGQAGADAGEAEAGALLVTEVDDGEGAARPGAAGAELVERGEGRDDAEGAVEGAAVGDGVEMRAGDDGVPGGGVTEPGPLVAVPVEFVGQAPAFGLRLKPRPAVGVGTGPGESAVTAAFGVPAHRREVAPHLMKRGGCGQSSAWGGTGGHTRTRTRQPTVCPTGGTRFGRGPVVGLRPPSPRA
ncbi:hypothetical protein GCM10020000_48840 [Streptomyces olivoverticillatus]